MPAKRDADGVPVRLDRECDIVLPRQLFTGWIPDSGPRAIVRALAPAERAQLESRAAALDEALQPFKKTAAQRALAKASIAALLSGYRAMRQQGDDALAIIEVTMAVLGEFPAWAIARACVSIVRGTAGLDRRFAPNDTELYDVVTAELKLYRQAQSSAHALLAAPIEPPAPTTRPTEAEIEAKLGRPITGRAPAIQPAPVKPWIPSPSLLADLEARKARNEQRTTDENSEAPTL